MKSQIYLLAFMLFAALAMAGPVVEATNAFIHFLDAIVLYTNYAFAWFPLFLYCKLYVAHKFDNISKGEAYDLCMDAAWAQMKADAQWSPLKTIPSIIYVFS